MHHNIISLKKKKTSLSKSYAQLVNEHETILAISKQLTEKNQQRPRCPRAVISTELVHYFSKLCFVKNTFAKMILFAWYALEKK